MLIRGPEYGSWYSLATGQAIRGSNPGRGRIFRARPERAWGPRSVLHNGYQLSYWGVKRSESGYEQPPHVAPRLKINRPITQLLLWAFMALSKVNFTYVVVQQTKQKDVRIRHRCHEHTRTCCCVSTFMVHESPSQNGSCVGHSEAELHKAIS